MRYNLRHLRVFLAVVDTGSVTRAAESCFISQPAVTQALTKLEAMLELSLFSRTPRGLFVNEAGKVLAMRVRRAFHFLDPAFDDLSSRLKVTATAAQLEALVAVRDTENFTLAAKKLGIAQPTVHRAVSHLEKEAGRPLFERSIHGTVAHRYTQNLVQAVHLAFAELEQIRGDLAAHDQDEAGAIVIGAMPLSRSRLLPMSLAQFRQQRRTTKIRIVEGNYSELLSGLRRGEIDFLIGALRDPLPIDDVYQECLFYDNAMIVAGTGHPLLNSSHIRIDELARYPWVVAGAGTPIRAQFDHLFADGLKKPNSIIECSSLILMRELLSLSDHLGFISAGQAAAEIKRKLMVPIPMNVGQGRRPIGLTTRVDWLPTAGQSLFLQIVKSLAIADENKPISGDILESA
jgi:LysR family transcriptional regulator of gallate degradation